MKKLEEKNQKKNLEIKYSVTKKNAFDGFIRLNMAEEKYYWVWKSIYIKAKQRNGGTTRTIGGYDAHCDGQPGAGPAS